eukprot:CAMPEP_0119512640 /NCGR_PEP_ID=MMETSP1344-20130328/30967_1 /TAXON_ID=236787 /ORGANISM="Florenciella parvula, Strain CCMP2471" /LENGTH=66 /DNA_ID=CAMNT_0007549777 /DNA_START=205 /DNA_END=405 /DNA_ORIENTATION=+
MGVLPSIATSTDESDWLKNDVARPVGTAFSSASSSLISRDTKAAVAIDMFAVLVRPMPGLPPYGAP